MDYSTLTERITSIGLDPTRLVTRQRGSIRDHKIHEEISYDIVDSGEAFAVFEANGRGGAYQALDEDGRPALFSNEEAAADYVWQAICTMRAPASPRAARSEAADDEQRQRLLREIDGYLD